MIYRAFNGVCNEFLGTLNSTNISLNITRIRRAAWNEEFAAFQLKGSSSRYYNVFCQQAILRICDPHGKLNLLPCVVTQLCCVEDVVRDKAPNTLT